MIEYLIGLPRVGLSHNVLTVVEPFRRDFCASQTRVLEEGWYYGWIYAICHDMRTTARKSFLFRSYGA